VSSHLLIDRAGSVTQFVPFDQRAWHAGVSEYAGVENCNDYSIGIELEGTDKIAYTEAQYQQLAEITRQLMIAYPAITADRIVGHCDVAPGRKTDPGTAFDWPYFFHCLESK
jgi:AmpD protein